MTARTAPTRGYRVCNRLLDVEANRYCEYDGVVPLDFDGRWRCPACGARRYGGDPNEVAP